MRSKLKQSLNNIVGLGPMCEGTRGKFKTTYQGTKYDDVRVTEYGLAAKILCDMHYTILSQLEERLANRGILKLFKCLDVRNWPHGTHQGDQFGAKLTPLGAPQ